jgi:hyperosmotically inducible protein
MVTMLALAGMIALVGCQNRADRGPASDQPPGPPGPAARAGEAARDAGQAAGNAVESVGQAAENAALTARVKNALLIAKDMDTSNLNVDTTKEGVVTLKGTVPTAAMKERAAKLAKQVAGVNRLRNELAVAAQARSGN